MTSSENGSHLARRSLLAGAGSLGVAAALPAPAAQAAPSKAVPSRGRYPSNRPGLTPYGLADTRLDLWPRKDNSFVLPLELRPRDKERGQVWMRDTYVNCFVVDGRPLYVATGTTRVPGLEAAAPWNDGIFVWVSRSLRGPWKLADTTGIRPGAEKGKVWSPEFAGENRPGRTVVAPWQKYWHDDRFGKRGQAWAPELHHFRGTWYIVACMGDHSRKVGSFLLVSEGGVEGPYRLAEGNREKPFGDPVSGGPDFIEPGAYHHIDGSLYSEGDDAWLVLHNDLYAKFRDDMEDIVPTTNLPKFQQQPYSPEPYLEGAYVFKHGGKYYLLHAAWNRASINPDGSTRHAYDPPGSGRVQYQYDAVVAVSDRFEGPYSKRWTAGVGAGHNNFFVDHDGHLWATFFRNPNFGHWSDPSRLADAAVAGVVRLEWTGPRGNRLYVERRDRGRASSD
ncbi:family 43 glycosylhydrolase [Streptomyces sp. NBC_01186]|uniref:family 43 glycosylhydrolase n=1 Tax=unclassified Streptomyces TaxID=2593676 RepID=UPI002DD89D9C|nr:MULTISPECIES: family 43 glycosylhydrolase [unclassified Streptomyces]WSB81239.1 family 43 glycosylhydrolase [Streptomyces sp. NBC_01775]WSS10553.1 family 43 glycosylhydrolase [Streptomyces sp. NBC_01186]